MDELTALAVALSASEQDVEISVQANEAVGQASGRRQAGSSSSSIVNFRKTWLYANSRLPPHLPPMLVYMPTWRLLCLAAKASLEVYEKPRGAQRQHHVEANWQTKTKHMVLESNPIDDQNLIIFAIRGSQMKFTDWSVNFNQAPTYPTGFLDDQGNACHAGFLAVARETVRPVAARLRQLLEENPSRASSSLLITGHSAGGAVAALLYTHMLSVTIESELTILLGCFKRVHCIIFGAPPVSLLPLDKPNVRMAKKSVFMSFVNEGDPIPRANKAYVLSLVNLLASPVPIGKADTITRPLQRLMHRLEGPRPERIAPYWPLPTATLSTAGRMILLRQRAGSTDGLAVEAVGTSDEQLRNCVFGDPSTHTMSLYKDRIDRLAVAAITGSNT